MSRTKSKTPIRWERLLLVLLNGGPISKEDIAVSMNYKLINRISAEIWQLKQRGAEIKQHRKGKTVWGYELLNPQDVRHLVEDRGFTVLPVIKNLNDLNAQTAQVAEKETATQQWDMGGLSISHFMKGDKCLNLK